MTRAYGGQGRPAPRVLVIAGADSSGGAGVARDLETLSAFGVRACLAVTAVTAQTHREVTEISAVAPALVAEQMRTAFAADAVHAVKIGMLATSGTVAAVADALDAWPDVPVVLDPVIASSSGRLLLSEDGLATLLQRLLPRATLVTPNLPELGLLAAGLAAAPDASRSAPKGAPAARENAAGLQGVSAAIASPAARLLAHGAAALLVKGGHDEGDEAIDCLLRTGQPAQRFASARLPVSLRGTGCMLASAIAAGLARSEDLTDAVSQGKAYLTRRFEVAENLCV
ncbi:hypothetical protein BJF93_13245 [Xaviernesmea oryzae]|uniref:hydroxymethylpyrimidine kinase n=1 Tax=Xaviernesmea oryzae TaxID=464029 RepID=A0A1Q9ARK1_9HYPH|nr:hypothetical protein BJF93_13245 [Xaviernesmea oryzae]